MEKITFDKKFFNIKDTLTCGQVFRFVKYENGYLVFSWDKCCYLYETLDKTIIECNVEDKEYFTNYFDLHTDYSSIYESAINSEYLMLKKSAEMGKGIRILNQNKVETVFSFIISQNNNIPRIKSIIEKLCVKFGKLCCFDDKSYYAFPTPSALANATLEELKETGLGYRAPFVKRLAESIISGFDINGLSTLPAYALKATLLNIYGIGEKVADCVMLFAYKKTDCFPVDTWMEKVYKEDFFGMLSNRKEMSKWFTETFGNNAGYFQQYMFHYKRNIEK